MKGWEFGTAYVPLWEAKQEALKGGNRSLGLRTRERYEAEYGPFESDEAYLASVGEILHSDIF